MLTTCTETVSILYAIVFGADGACIAISTGSILAAFAAFMVIVILAQFVARKLWAKLTLSTSHNAPEKDRPFSDDPHYRESAIRPSKR